MLFAAILVFLVILWLFLKIDLKYTAFGRIFKLKGEILYRAFLKQRNSNIQLFKTIIFCFYYLAQDDSKLLDNMVEENNERLAVAHEYLINLNSSEHNFLDAASRNTIVVICLVTIRRNVGGSYNPDYLLQSSTAFHRAIKEEQGRSGRQEFSLIICDVDPEEHPEAQQMSSFMPTIVRREREPSSRDEKINIKEREKRDYVFCLRQARDRAHGGHVLMVEDDTLPKPEMLRVLSILMSRTKLANVAFIKV